MQIFNFLVIFSFLSLALLFTIIEGIMLIKQFFLCIIIRRGKKKRSIINEVSCKIINAFIFLTGFEPSPAPVSGHDTGSPSVQFSPPLPAPSESPAPMTVENGGDVNGAPEMDGDEFPAAEEEEEEEEVQEVVRWCAVREEEYEGCRHLVSLLKETDGYTWKWYDL